MDVADVDSNASILGVGGGATGARSVSQNLKSGLFRRGEGCALMAAATSAERSDGGSWRCMLWPSVVDGGLNLRAGLSVRLMFVVEVIVMICKEVIVMVGVYRGL